MWRSSRVILYKDYFRLNYRMPNVRNQSSKSSGGGAAKMAFAVIGATAVIAGGTVAYAKYDPKFRKSVEESVPMMSEVFKYYPGPDTDVKKTEPSKDLSHDSGLLKKRQERETVKKPEPTPIPPSPPLSTPKRVLAEKAEPKSAPVASSLSDRKEKEKAEGVEKGLAKDVQMLDKYLNDAMAALTATIEAIQLHTKKVISALDEEDPATEEVFWNEANSAAEARKALQKKSDGTISEIRNQCEKLQNAVQKEKGSKYRNDNLLNSVEEAVSQAKKKISDAEKKMSIAEASSQAAFRYKELVETGMEQFTKEIQSVIPDAKFGVKGTKLTEDQVNFIVAHAHRKVANLKKQLAKQQAISIQQMNTGSGDGMSDSLEEKHNQIIEQLKDQQEIELRQQLRRQAAAHMDHLQEVLSVQQKELERKYKVEMDDALLEEKKHFQNDLSANAARLTGLEGYLKARNELDKVARHAQLIWLSGQALRQSLKSGDESPKPLKQELSAIRDAVGKTEPFIESVLNGLPPTISERGVVTEEALKCRFRKVDKLCQRVAMIGDQGGTLYQYAMSYLHSLLIIKTRHVPLAELEGKTELDPAQWDTFDILARVRLCLQREDFVQALRYANQLTGQPRKVARDWINELRLNIETRQVADILLAHATARGLEALPTT